MTDPYTVCFKLASFVINNLKSLHWNQTHDTKVTSEILHLNHWAIVAWCNALIILFYTYK